MKEKLKNNIFFLLPNMAQMSRKCQVAWSIYFQPSQAYFLTFEIFPIYFQIAIQILDGGAIFKCCVLRYESASS